MNDSEAVAFSEKKLRELQKLVTQGEGQTLEFKRKAAHPDKIVREIVAFANTQGGILLIGVDDNGGIPGVKYPDEELLVMTQALAHFCTPPVSFTHAIIPVSANRFVVRFDISISDERPHFYKLAGTVRESFVRSGDMSVKASREMLEIVRRSKLEKDTRFTFGEAEKALMNYLEKKNAISLGEFRVLARLNKVKATRKLVLLVLANVLRIQPTEKGDIYSRR